MLRPRTIAVAAAALAAAALCLAAALTPGSFSAYVASVKNSTDTAATAPFFTCAAALANDRSSALFTLPLNEASGSTTAIDTDTGTMPGTYRGTMTTSTTAHLACSRDTGGAYVLNGTTSYVSTSALQSSPATFSEEVWFKTTVASGRLIGYGNAVTGASSTYDRQVYLNTSGQLVFGTYNGGFQTIASSAAYDDGAWHDVVATFSATTGMTLYVDGAKVAGNTAYTTAQTNNGYWRVGYDNLSGWPGTGTNYFFTGSMRFASVYSTVLTTAQITTHYAAGR
ncbi:signal peptidase I [Frondihabitans sp. PAMC 28766]|nr:signal peptidase I [Frondihabitans sp. PAMC 28766]